MSKAFVALTVYNDAAYLAEAIQSILAQTFADFTLLIINDGSTDESAHIIENFAQIDGRIRCISLQENVGRPRARNRALDAACTAHKEEGAQYLFWMDGDDISLPERLERQIVFMESRADISVQGTAMQCFGGAEHVVKPALSHAIMKAQSLWISPIVSATACVRLKDFVNTNLRYDAQLSRVEDYAFWLDTLFTSPLRMSNTGQILYKYRYFHRPTNTKYHAMAVKRLLQTLHLPHDTLSTQKHAMLANSDFSLVPDMAPQTLLHWANQVYEAVLAREDIQHKAFLRITAYKVERLLASISDKHLRQDLMRELVRLSLGKLF